MNNPVVFIRQLFPADDSKRIFLVGGCVRDRLLERSGSDIDLVASLPCVEIQSRGFRQVSGKTTVPVWFRHDETIGAIEITLIPDVRALAADLSRRDFTINAMAMTLDGEVIDPLDGRADLINRLLRACTPQTFRDDPMRIFRALRFEADGWEMHPETEKLIRDEEWSHSWAAIPIERFSREMLKALELNEPEKFFQRMLELGTGKEYLPEIFRMLLIPAGPLIHHPEGDLLTHSCQVLQRVSAASSEPLTRFCAMFHDIGKLATSPDLYPKHHGHDQAGFSLALEFCRRLRLSAQYGTALAWISRLHGTFNLWDQLRDATKLRVADQAIKAGIVDILPLVAAADKAGGKEPDEWRVVVGIAGMSATALGIDLNNLQQMAPQKRADFILQARLEQLRLTLTTST